MTNRMRKGPLVAVPVVLAALIILALVATGRRPGGATLPSALAFSPTLDPGTPLSGGVAPDFTLTDQLDRPVSLRAFRGRVVLLAFTDSECTTICPLTTTAMVDAQRMLGPAGAKVALLGVNANPRATSVADVRSYSELHGMTRLWHFGTGTRTQLQRVWNAYHISAAITAGQIDHTPALFVISPRGRLERLYLTQLSYVSVPQQAQILAREVSRLLPGHPVVHSHLTYRAVPTITPGQHTRLSVVDTGGPGVGSRTLELGPGHARLLLFFASWDQEVMNLRAHLTALNAYAQQARHEGLPQLAAVDEGSVEPNASALGHLLAGLPTRPAYPIVVDAHGRLADGYGVQDEPWLVLVSRSGSPLWFQDAATTPWPGTTALIQQVRAALRTGSGPVSPAVVRRELAGSPAPLAALHAQAGKLIGGLTALKRELRRLRGYPVVVNFWASSCAPCKAEFGLFASAAAQFGRRVAFLGADVSDNSGDARAFLAGHPVSYPSYPITIDQVTSLLPQGLLGTPTTVFYTASGRRAYTHAYQYRSQGTLDSDITTYALGG